MGAHGVNTRSIILAFQTYFSELCLKSVSVRSLFFKMHVFILSFPYLMQWRSHIKSDLSVKYTVDWSRLAGRGLCHMFV